MMVHLQPGVRHIHSLLFFHFILFSLAKPTPPPAFSIPVSDAFDHVNLLIGNGGETPDGSGGTIPSTAPPFAMTRWVAQTHQNYVSVTPYNWTADTIHGFQGTRQPAIWMGESGPVVVIPGVSRRGSGKGVDMDGLKLKTKFEERGMKMKKETEVITPSYYSVVLEDGYGGEILVEQSATSRVGHLRFTFNIDDAHTDVPYIVLESSRPSVITSTPTNISFPHGTISIQLGPTTNGDDTTSSQNVHEICGSTDERQDRIITPISTAIHAEGFRGYYCARFDYDTHTNTISVGHGTIQNSTVHIGALSVEGKLLQGYALLQASGGKAVVSLRVGTSFISIEQARKNIDEEASDHTCTFSPHHTLPYLLLGSRIYPPSAATNAPQTLEQTALLTRTAWTTALDRFKLEDATAVEKEVFFTGVVHAFQYPSEQHEQGAYYSGYDGQVHRTVTGGSGGETLESYTGYSIWDTYRAEWALLILLAPERVPGMVRSMLADYKEGGWLPMWKNMVGTHADSLVAEAVVKGVTGFDRELAWEAVWKDATVPPVDDWNVSHFDRQENVDYEVRAGLSSVYNVEGKGWVADDVHSESGSRTLDYAYDDYAAYKLGEALGKPTNVTEFLRERAMRTPFTLYNDDTGFMEARDADGSWAGEGNGWTEGDKWIYSFDVVHDIPELIKRRGGNESFVKSLDDHFNGGHNVHSNEPSHHIPYLYALAGAAYKTQERVREIAKANYNNTPIGLSGNEDCGQMSAWYIFSAMGFYPVNPVSGEYVVGSPFFEKMSIELPPRPNDGERPGQERRTLMIVAEGAKTKPYIKSLTINGRVVDAPVIRHEDIVGGGMVVFEMSEKVEAWGNLISNEEQGNVSERAEADDDGQARHAPPERNEL
ncbi:glycoside hydrolase family 92 protein [Collybia nuda]|uniref:Glycoside hydrolase family 92 protein n=1 Tax=Collybia nuda TaxID=64659 RepID=A0A9P5Y5B0_9AGAR|nr:glycoside hydrolase family 92 protein [Collybia nuda]